MNGVFNSRLLAAGILMAVRCWAEPLEQPVSVQPKTPAATDPDVAATVVVFNERDPVSADLAGKYAEKRNIPFNHLVGIACPVEETISRADYDQLIANPLRKALITRGWWHVEPSSSGERVLESSIRFVALMRGIPLKITPVANYPGDNPEGNPQVSDRNEASVDSELATLGFNTRHLSGVVNNPYYRSFAPLGDLLIPHLLLVCRLDAADASTVRRMIDDSVAVEKKGLWGFAYVDSRHFLSGGLALGDEWLRHIAMDVTKHGIPCVFDDSPEVFPEHYPIRDAALYFGWYSEQFAGAFKDEQVRFVPGAVAVHIHSFSANSLRLPLSNWCAPLLDRGAAATLGNVYEPFLSFTPNLDIFEERLRNGFTFAEAAYASEPVLSWMTTFIGDPLYRPFKAQQDVTGEPAKPVSEWVAYRDGTKLWFDKGRTAGQDALQAKGKALKSGIIFEGLGWLQDCAKDSEAALRSWEQAGRYYKNEEDQIRCALHAIELLRVAGKNKEALSLVRRQIREHPKANATALLRVIETEMTAPGSSKSPQPLPPSNAAR